MKLQAGILPGLRVALSVFWQQPIPLKTAYWTKRILSKIEPEAQAFDEIRMKLVEKYAEKDENGKLKEENNRYILTDPEGFQKEFEPLAADEVEIPFHKIKVKMADLEGVKISMEQLAALEFVMDIEMEEEDAEGQEAKPPLEIVSKEDVK